MRVLIVGVGGVGGYIASQLIKNTDAEVTLLARGEHLKKIQKDGLHILEDNEDYIVQPFKAIDNPKNEGIFDFIIISVKSYDLESVVQKLSKNIGSKTIILPLLNGIDHDLTIKKYYPDAKILKGCIYIVSHIASPGTIVKKGEVFKLCWGDIDAIIEDFSNIAALFDAANFRHKFSNNIDYEIWKKYLFIAAMAALTCYYNKSMDQIANEHTQELEALLQEIVTLAQAKSINLTNKEIQAALNQAQKVTQGAKTSMQRDLERGNKSEIDSLLGYIVKSAKNFNLKVPIMEKIYLSLKES